MITQKWPCSEYTPGFAKSNTPENIKLENARP